MAPDAAARAPRAGLGRALRAASLAAFFLATALALPAAAQTPPPTIAAAGDIACSPRNPAYNDGMGEDGQCKQMATSDILVAGGFTAVLTLGDNQYEKGSYRQFNTVYEPSWGRVKAITYPSIGNHEYGTPGATGYFRYFGSVGAGVTGEGYYSFDVGDWHLVALNSQCGAVPCGRGSAQQLWLKADLAANPTACTLAYFHHPLFSSGAHGDSRFVKALWWTLYNGGADVILNGHEHTYERFAPMDPSGKLDRDRGIRELVVGTGGKSHFPFTHKEPHSQARNHRTYGVLSLTLKPAGYAWEFIPVQKSFNDSGHARCH